MRKDEFIVLVLEESDQAQVSKQMGGAPPSAGEVAGTPGGSIRVGI